MPLPLRPRVEQINRSLDFMQVIEIRLAACSRSMM
jgi:hypothetical protein